MEKLCKDIQEAVQRCSQNSDITDTTEGVWLIELASRAAGYIEGLGDQRKIMYDLAIQSGIAGHVPDHFYEKAGGYI